MLVNDLDITEEPGLENDCKEFLGSWTLDTDTKLDWVLSESINLSKY